MTPAEIIDNAAALQNDPSQTFYTDVKCLPYLNMAMDKLKLILEENDIPLVEETTDVITMLAGSTRLSYGTTPSIPYGFVEPKLLWESLQGQNQYMQMSRRERLPHNLGGVTYTYFRIYAWNGDELRFLPASNNLDIKIDYVREIITTPIAIADIDKQFTSIGLRKFGPALYYLTGALCSMFIGENPDRATVQATEAVELVGKALGITIKPKQSILTKRRPFRAAYKLKSTW